MEMKQNDVLRIITPEVSGWGDPLERDPEMVLRDVRDEKVSHRRALEAYRVVIDEVAMEVDIAATERLRERRKEAR